MYNNVFLKINKHVSRWLKEFSKMIMSNLFATVHSLLEGVYLSRPPTRSRGIKRNSLPCFRNMFPAVCCGLMPTPSLVMIALVFGLTLNSSAQYFSTAVNGAASGT